MLDYARMAGARITGSWPFRSSTALRAFLVRLHVSTILLGLYWSLLFVATHMPMHVGRSVRVPSDKLVHFVSYAVLAALLAWTLSGTARLRATWLLVLLVLVGAYGAVDELTQALVPSRTADLMDWVADVSGAACGLLAVALLRFASARVSRRRRADA